MLSDKSEVEFIDDTVRKSSTGRAQSPHPVCLESRLSETSPDRPLLAYCDRLINSFFPIAAGEHPPSVDSFQYGLKGSKHPASVNMLPRFFLLCPSSNRYFFTGNRPGLRRRPWSRYRDLPVPQGSALPWSCIGGPALQAQTSQGRIFRV